MGPSLPSPREILCNHTETEKHLDKPSHPVNFEQIRNYLLGQKATQKKIMIKDTKPDYDLSYNQDSKYSF